MPNQMKTAILATKVFEEYKRLWKKAFSESPEGAKDSFKIDLLKGNLTACAKKSVGMNDFNFVLTRSGAHKILEHHQKRYVRLDDQDAILMNVWAEIIMNVYGEKVDVDTKKTPLDANLFNNMWPILENSVKVISGIDLNKQQIECMNDFFDKYGYTATKDLEEKLQKIKEAKVEFSRLSKQFEDRAKADQKRIAELEAEVKKYNKIFTKLKAAI